EELNGLLSDANDQALALREALLRSDTSSGSPAADKDASDETAPAAPAVDPVAGMAALRSTQATFAQVAESMKGKIESLLAQPPSLTSSEARASFAQWKTKTQTYLKQLPAVSQKLREWNPDKPVPAYRAVTSFLFGMNWTMASFWQDWYGIIPLLVGSIMVSIVALVIAVP